MPQYEFYIVPQNARCATFAHLFQDNYSQLQTKGQNLGLALLFPAESFTIDN